MIYDTLFVHYLVPSVLKWMCYRSPKYWKKCMKLKSITTLDYNIKRRGKLYWW